MHRHAHARRANLAVAHVAHGVFRFPVEHVGAMLQAAVERARVGDFAEVRGHLHAFAHHVLFAQFNGVASELFGQLVHGGFNCELALRGAEASVGAEGCMFVYTTFAVNLNASSDPVYSGMDLWPVRPTVAQPCSP